MLIDERMIEAIVRSMDLYNSINRNKNQYTYIYICTYTHTYVCVCARVFVYLVCWSSYLPMFSVYTDAPRHVSGKTVSATQSSYVSAGGGLLHQL